MHHKRCAVISSGLTFAGQIQYVWMTLLMTSRQRRQERSGFRWQLLCADERNSICPVFEPHTVRIRLSLLCMDIWNQSASFYDFEPKFCTHIVNGF